MMNKPLAAHTALAVCHGNTNNTARLISTRPASNTTDKPRSKRTSLRTMSSRAASNIPAINASPISDALSKPLQPALNTATDSPPAPCSRNREQRTAEQLHGERGEQERPRLQAQADEQRRQPGQRPTDRRAMGEEEQWRQQIKECQPQAGQHRQCLALPLRRLFRQRFA